MLAEEATFQEQFVSTLSHSKACCYSLHMPLTDVMRLILNQSIWIIYGCLCYFSLQHMQSNLIHVYLDERPWELSGIYFQTSECGIAMWSPQQIKSCEKGKIQRIQWKCPTGHLRWPWTLLHWLIHLLLLLVVIHCLYFATYISPLSQ